MLEAEGLEAWPKGYHPANDQGLYQVAVAGDAGSTGMGDMAQG